MISALIMYNPKSGSSFFLSKRKKFLPVLILIIGFEISSAAAVDPPGWRSFGITDIDETRIEVLNSPTTTQNAISRRASLYRWWRCLMHQGYDMSPLDETTDILLQETTDLWLYPEEGSLKWRIYTGGIMLENVPSIYGNKLIAHFKKTDGLWSLNNLKYRIYESI